MSKRSPHAEMLVRIHLLERHCVAAQKETELAYFGELARLLRDLGAALEHQRDPSAWLFTVASLARRRAEALVLRRVRVWRSSPSARGEVPDRVADRRANDTQR